jgi:hypothetical protein
MTPHFMRPRKIRVRLAAWWSLSKAVAVIGLAAIWIKMAHSSSSLLRTMRLLRRQGKS